MPPPRASDSATNPCYRPTHDPGVNEAWDDPVAALRLRSLVPKVTPTQTTINDLMIQGNRCFSCAIRYAVARPGGEGHSWPRRVPGPVRLGQRGRFLKWGPDMNRTAMGTAAVILAFSLASCSGSAPTRPPEDGGTYESIDDLREAVESAGLLCQELVLDTPPSKFSATSASCSEFTYLAIYTDDVYLSAQLDFWRPVGQRAINVGKNWTVVSEDPKLIQKNLGGSVLHTGP